MTNSALDQDNLDAVATEDTTPEKKFVWFVHEGRMHSSWVIGHMDIDVEVHPSCERFDGTEVASGILSDTQDTRRLLGHSTRLNDMLTRPGRWFYLSGQQVQHEEDLYDSKEMAAQAYALYLMK